MVNKIIYDSNASVVFDAFDTVPGPRPSNSPSLQASSFILHPRHTCIHNTTNLHIGSAFETVPTFLNISNAARRFREIPVALSRVALRGEDPGSCSSNGLYVSPILLPVSRPPFLIPQVPELSVPRDNRLAILPYYIEVTLVQDLVRLVFLPSPKC